MSTIKQWLVDSLTTNCISSRPTKRLQPLNALRINGFGGALSCLYILAVEQYLKRSRPDTEPTIINVVEFIMQEDKYIDESLIFHLDMNDFLLWLLEQQIPDDPVDTIFSCSWHVEKWNEYQNKKAEVKK